MAPIVITIPNTAATIPNPGRASAVFDSTVTGGVVLFLDDLELGVQQTGQLFGRRTVDEWRETVADEFNDMMVVGDLRILADDLAVMRIADVPLEHQ